MSLNFKGRVAVVTGAGGGLGREYALLFAQKGASVVVNDLGGSGKGDGQSHSAADGVVQEIRSKGGKAVANYDSVEDGDNIIKTAIDNFGRVDIVVNNAGILRDRSFLKMTDADWDIIHRIHLRGSFKVSRAAWPYMRDQGYGRIIMTASGAGIYGNFGQTNYSSAKLGLIGLSNSLGVEGAKYNIHSNVIVPIAASRLTADIFPPELTEKLKPVHIAPAVVWLCHEDCSDNGGVYESAGGWFGKYRWQRSAGKTYPVNRTPITPEMVRDNWDTITDMSDPTYPSTIHENISAIAEAVDNVDEIVDNGTDGDTINVDKIRAMKLPSKKYSYQPRDVILYALGLGISKSDEHYLKYVYEGSEEFSVLPTFGVIPAQSAMFDSNIFSGGLRNLNIDLTKILHGEQYMELLQPLPPSGDLVSETKIADVLDKGSGAVIVLNVDTYDNKGNHLIKNQFTVFAVGAGGFGGKRNSDRVIPFEDVPTRAPDATMESKTNVDQAGVYRLSGDWNPLHIDPNFSALGGFSEPILHGLCSFGVAARHVLQKYANDDVTKFKAIKARFTKPVIPGNTLQTEMWKEGKRVYFRTKVRESGNAAVQGYVELHEIVDAVSAGQGPKLQCEPFFDALNQKVTSMPKIAAGVNGCFQWNITVDGNVQQIWTLDLKGSPPSVYKGNPKNSADVTLTIADEDMVALGGGKLKPQQAFMSGKLKIKGNIMLTQKLEKIFQQQAKL